MNSQKLPKEVQFAVWTGALTINSRNKEQATGLGILVQQTRAVSKYSKLGDSTAEERARRVREEITKQIVQFITTFESSSQLTSDEREDIVRQIQEKITRQAIDEIEKLATKERIAGSASEDLVDRMENTPLSWERLSIALAELLPLSRRSEPDPQVLQINPLVVHSEKTLRYLIREDIVLEVKLAPDSWWAYFDLFSIHGAIITLVWNACEAMPEGGHLTIETSNVALDNEFAKPHSEARSSDEYVVLAVRDTGIGMSNDVKRQAFEPYFTTKDKEKHQGVGLASVRGIVESVGGYVQLESEEGIGTVVAIYLPRVAKPDPLPNLLEANVEVGDLIHQKLVEFGKYR